ncbi:MAG: DUF4266 domain-containing protein [Deltaproteobacteria bacterium]|nr:DUF4266 domain-containing protein [Deltaproteobacteria bacterium]
MTRFLLLVVVLSGCAVVRPYEREHLTDPTMTDDAVESASMRKLHTSREGAGGGDGAPAGGGCGCSN